MTQDNKRTKDLVQILHVVKIASLFFSATAFFQYYFQSKEMYYVLTNDWLMILAVLIIVLLIYGFWQIINSKGENNYIISTWVQPLIFIIISFLAIYLTGSYQSHYKFLFLFIIISVTIEYGTKLGLIISSFCSAIIISMDILLPPASVVSGMVNTYFESDLVLVCVFISISWIIGFYSKIEQEHIFYLKNLVKMDGLTKLYNHRYFYEQLAKEIEAANKNRRILSLLFIDIDYFKYYNDVNGHQKGDDALVIIAKTLKELTREQDFVARYGGEEFAIILPNTSGKEAYKIGDDIRQRIQELYFQGQEYLPNHNLTISVGISSYPTQAKTEDEIIKFADEALYRAKCFRKNRVEAYTSILDDLKPGLNDNDKEIIASIRTLIAVINAKDKYTFSHVERVVTYCRLLADVLGLDEERKKVLIYSAYMHDIGKINISEDILMKEKALNAEEWAILQKHPENGVEIIKNVYVLRDVIPVILQHHERFDGNGYPLGIRGENINYLARVLAVADSFDAMTSYRPYQKKKSFALAFDELYRCSGTQFDPEIVRIFIQSVKTDLTPDM